MKLRLVKNDDALQQEARLLKKQGVWQCKECPAFGSGGVEGWSRHYMREHYRAGA